MKYFTQKQINDIIKECNPNTIKYIYDTGEENNNPNLNKVIAAKFSKNELVFMCKKYLCH